MNKCYDGITEEYEKIFKAQGNGNGPNKPPALSKKQKAQALSKHFHARFSPKGNIETQEMLLIANSLNWYKEMIIFSNAENPHNLVFGTFETNSLMTRYEVAWQSFMLYRYELQKMSNIVQLVATKQELPHKMPQIMSSDRQLLIRTNVPEVDLEYDYYGITGTRKYKRKRFPLWDEQKAQAQRNDFKQVPGGALSDAEMCQAAKDYFFIAHTIEYSLVHEHTSRLLKRRGLQQKVYFYPFSRPLLHKLEADLDRKLLAHLYRSTKQDLVEDWNDLGPIKTPGSKATKGRKGANQVKRVSESDVQYADVEGYSGFQELISDLNLGGLGDFGNFQDMKTITDFGDFGPSANGIGSDLGDWEDNEEDVEEDGEEDGEEDVGGREDGETNKRRLLDNSVRGSLYNRIEAWNAKGKKDQERKFGELYGLNQT
ncbi:hypothetical protein CDV31_006583 [Fusarium ambrosium]|uniref:Uncharacterized protein n=1 Tax=Fusarium ambrosium TaxID=131363 RepID=A0A428UBY5_9HYPO|nr:hypothetical protein CDV31_006583 [Fusarium ambrosium]